MAESATAASHEKQLYNLIWQLKLQAERSLTLRVGTLRQLLADPDKLAELMSLSEASGDPALVRLVQDIRKAQQAPAARAPSRSGSRGALWGFVAAALGVVLMLVWWIGRGDGTPAPQAVATVASTAAKPAVELPERRVFRLHGSNTVGEKLAPALIESWMKASGAAAVEVVDGAKAVERTVVGRFPQKGERWTVELHAHGSSTAFKDLGSGTTDIGMSSRRIKDTEVASLKRRYGDLSAAGAEHVVGLDGLAVIVHRSNPLAALTSADVARIFAGEIRDWSEVGGAAGPIELHARDDVSGTYDTFRSLVLEAHGKSLSGAAHRYESSTELSDRVAAAPAAIGFIGLPYVRNAKALGIAEEAGTLPIVPTSFTVGTEDYPLSRRLYLYAPAQPATPEAASFIAHALSTTGQDVVRDVGLISQNIYAQNVAPDPTLPRDYVALTDGAERLSLNFRFRPASYQLDNKGQRDLDRMVEFLSRQPTRTPMLLGFTDNYGEVGANVALSLERARAVERELQARGLYPRIVRGFGPAIAVASNRTESGREKNRRVEVWLR
ncbi:MAG: phosphate ABC transporter substrate-binding/OmpA family protein [Sinimarinibacterium flocculans]|uniref:phosphate ABC transporter substrate-binding/OmpA family protein n=1 Tax=Sinimarinibacterium flocculans TaxID=985250 RepID=UPI003C32EA72